MLNIAGKIKEFRDEFEKLKELSLKIIVEKEETLPEFEKVYLNNVVAVIEKQYQKYISYLERSNEELNKLLIEKSESAVFSPELDDPDDPINDREIMTGKSYEIISEVKGYIDMLRELILRYSQPYFGSVKLKNKNGQFYIGKSAISDIDTYKLLVSDWRSKIGEIYYDFNSDSELVEKRIYEIKKGRLIDLYISRKGNKSADIFLQKQLRTKKASKLQDIVSTIQSDQNEIIRNEINVPLIIQGVAGSGKTTILFHRLSYLIYEYPKQFKPTRMLIVAPTKYFVDYVDEISYSLGIGGVNVLTLFNLLKKELNLDIPFVFKDSELEKKNMYGSMEYLKLLEENYSKGILSLVKRIELSSKYKAKFIKVFIDKLRENGFMSFEELLNMTKDVVASEIIDDIEYEKCLEIIDKAIKETINPVNIYFEVLKILSSEDKKITNSHILNESFVSQFKKFLKDSYIKESNIKKEYQEFEEIDLESFENIDDSFSQKKERKLKNYIYVSNEDLLSLLYIKYLASNNFTSKYDVVCIDEAQGYSISMLYVLSKLAIADNVIFAGDLSQNIEKNTTFLSWEELSKNIGILANYFTLSKSYRIPKEIMEACREITLNDTKISFPECILSKKDSVEKYRVSSFTGKEITVALDKILDRYLVKEALSCVIISSEAEVLDYLYEFYSKSRKYFDFLKNKNTFSNTLRILSPSDIKGLEFDVVILFDDDLVTNKEKYLAATRSLSKFIYFSK